MTPSEYTLWQIRHQPSKVQDGEQSSEFLPSKSDIEHESELHEWIESWCKRQDPPVPYVHQRMDKKTTTAKGTPDFSLLMAGQTIWIECKGPDGELSDEQKDFHAAADHQGIKVHTIWTIQQFVEVVRSFGKP